MEFIFTITKTFWMEVSMVMSMKLFIDSFFTNTRINRCLNTDCVFHQPDADQCRFKEIDLNSCGACQHYEPKN
jgi:hypothetical protein